MNKGRKFNYRDKIVYDRKLYWVEGSKADSSRHIYYTLRRWRSRSTKTVRSDRI